MISKTSLFDKGIFKSTLKRFAWGSILYFILLFLFTGMMILLNESPEMPRSYWSNRGGSTLLGGQYMVIAMLLSIVVPSVAGLLVFRSIHSKKTSVFIHSLPVKRTANYISSVLAVLTLMVVPVVLNAVVLMIMSATTYSLLFSVGDCVVWMLLSIFSLFVMFSCVCFVASITGNSFGMIGLNILFHSIGLILAAAFTMVCEIFLYGFTGDANLFEKVYNSMFITKVPTIMLDWCHAEKQVLAGYSVDIVIFVIAALVLYIVSGILYNKRRMETAEDVAGFKCLNTIFKYLVTFVGASGTFAIFCYSLDDNSFLVWSVVLIVSAVVYFAAEMLLKKTLRVWNSYKGYLGFAAAFALMLCFFAFTSFFGFESYVPEQSDIKSVSIHDIYDDSDRDFSDDHMIAAVLLTHEELLAEKEVIAINDDYSDIFIEYELKNGKTVNRVYGVSEEHHNTIMSRLYANNEYKQHAEDIFTPMDVHSISLKYNGNLIAEIDDKQLCKDLVECINKDVGSLSYNQIHASDWGIAAEVYYIPTKTDAETANPAMNAHSETTVETMYIPINVNYTNTFNWIRENGYWESAAIHNVGVMYVCRDIGEMLTDIGNGVVDSDKFIKIDKSEDIEKIIEFAHTVPREYISRSEVYTICHCPDENTPSYNTVCELTKEELSKLMPDIDWGKLK